MMNRRISLFRGGYGNSCKFLLCEELCLCVVVPLVTDIFTLQVLKLGNTTDAGGPVSRWKDPSHRRPLSVRYNRLFHTSVLPYSLSHGRVDNNVIIDFRRPGGHVLCVLVLDEPCQQFLFSVLTSNFLFFSWKCIFLRKCSDNLKLWICKCISSTCFIQNI